jgi:hypothetical protein
MSNLADADCFVAAPRSNLMFFTLSELLAQLWLNAFTGERASTPACRATPLRSLLTRSHSLYASAQLSPLLLLVVPTLRSTARCLALHPGRDGQARRQGARRDLRSAQVRRAFNHPTPLKLPLTIRPGLLIQDGAQSSPGGSRTIRATLLRRGRKRLSTTCTTRSRIGRTSATLATSFFRLLTTWTSSCPRNCPGRCQTSTTSSRPARVMRPSIPPRRRRPASSSRRRRPSPTARVHRLRSTIFNAPASRRSGRRPALPLARARRLCLSVTDTTRRRHAGRPARWATRRPPLPRSTNRSPRPRRTAQVRLRRRPYPRRASVRAAWPTCGSRGQSVGSSAASTSSRTSRLRATSPGSSGAILSASR